MIKAESLNMAIYNHNDNGILAAETTTQRFTINIDTGSTSISDHIGFIIQRHYIAILRFGNAFLITKQWQTEK